MKNNHDTVKRTRSENAEFVIAAIKSYGLHLHPESRLMRMHRVLTSVGGVIPPDAPEFETALEAERDLQILSFVIELESKQSTDDEFVKLIKKAIKDSMLPNEDRSNSKGRDAQFELFIAAVCQNAGLNPVAREEPDVTCHIEGIKFGVAAKRIKNVKNLKKHVRKAAQQIEASGYPGIIALDTNMALNRNNERFIAPIPDDRFEKLYRQALKNFLDIYRDNILHWVQRKGVRGIVVHDQQVRLEFDNNWSLAGMTMYMDTSDNNCSQSNEFRLFSNNYNKGLPNVQSV